MKEVGLPVVIRAPQADETIHYKVSPRRLAAQIAREKAESLAGHHIPAIIIAADTIVVAPDGKTVFGKPRNVGDAARMLRTLSGREHTVHTAYCILQTGTPRPKRILRVITSRVRVRKLTTADIRNYIATGEPMDKAGAYAAQGCGMALIESIRGSYTNVVGLPMAQLLADLEFEFGLPLFALFQRKRKKPKARRKGVRVQHV